MTDLKKPLTYVIIESSTLYKYEILGTMLSIQYVDPLSNIVLSISDETRNLLEKMPIEMTCTLDFYDSSEISNSKMNLVRRYLHNLYDISHYAVNKYGRCLFVNESLLMINNIEINDSIEENGFGFLKKFFKGHSEETRSREYSFELIFMNNLTFINNVHSLIKEKYDIDISDLSDFGKEFLTEEYSTLPYDYKNNFETKVFLEKQSLITTEDFFGFENELKLNEIQPDFTFKEKVISFLGLRLTQPNPHLKSLNKEVVKYLTAFNNFIVPAFSLKYFKERLTFNIPKKSSIGVWCRESTPLGLYQLIDYYVENYSEFFSKIEKNVDYFNICARVLYDKSDISCLQNELKNYGNIYLFNSDNEVKRQLDKHIKSPNYFVFYYADYPIDIDNFRNENDILTNKRSDDKLSVSKIIKNGKTRYPATGRRGMLYKTLLKLLLNHKYAHMKTHDFGLMMTLLGAGTIPVLKEPPAEPFKLLKENVHYLVAKKDAKPLTKKKYETMRKNLNDFYEEHLHPEKTLRKLMHYLFVRDVE